MKKLILIFLILYSIFWVSKLFKLEKEVVVILPAETPIETPTITIKPTIKPTPLPTLTPEPIGEVVKEIVKKEVKQLFTPPPLHCAITYDYRIGEIDDYWLNRDYDYNSLKGFLLEAEEIWENEVGFNLFNYSSTSDNFVNFTNNTTFTNPDLGKLGAVDHFVYKNGTGENDFEVYIFSLIFESSSHLVAEGSYMVEQKRNNSIILEVMTHELGHIIGLEHLHIESAVMTKHFFRIREVELTEADKTYIGEFCK